MTSSDCGPQFWSSGLVWFSPPARATTGLKTRGDEIVIGVATGAAVSRSPPDTREKVDQSSTICTAPFANGNTELILS